MRKTIVPSLLALILQSVGAEPLAEVKVDGLSLGMTRKLCDQVQYSQDGSIPREGLWAPGQLSVLYCAKAGVNKNPTVAVFDNTGRLVLVKGARLQVNAESFAAGEKLSPIVDSLGQPEVEQDGWTSVQGVSSPGPDFEERCKELGVEGVGDGFLRTERRLLYPSLGLSVEASGLTSEKVFSSAELALPKQSADKQH